MTRGVFLNNDIKFVVGGVIHQPYYNYKNEGAELGRTMWGLVGLGMSDYCSLYTSTQSYIPVLCPIYQHSVLYTSTQSYYIPALSPVYQHSVL